jgi:hypothetical protein
MAGKRKVYGPEFELAAVKMVTDQKLSAAEVARRLGVTENRLRDWPKAPPPRAPMPSPAPVTWPHPRRRAASSEPGSSDWGRSVTS